MFWGVGVLSSCSCMQVCICPARLICHKKLTSQFPYPNRGRVTHSTKTELDLHRHCTTNNTRAFREAFIHWFHQSMHHAFRIRTFIHHPSLPAILGAPLPQKKHHVSAWIILGQDRWKMKVSTSMSSLISAGSDLLSSYLLPNPLLAQSPWTAPGIGPRSSAWSGWLPQLFPGWIFFEPMVPLAHTSSGRRDLYDLEETEFLIFTKYS